jgi:nucleotide-binding universal stress UspA family protein
VVTGIKGAAVTHALDRAVLEAEVRHQPLRVLSAWQPAVWLGDIGTGWPGPAVASQDSEALAQERTASALEQALHDGQTPHALRATAVVQTGNPCRLLTEATRRAALLVVGGNGRSPWRNALAGSPLRQLLRHGRCPVMVVPDSAAESAFQRVVVAVQPDADDSAALQWAYEEAARHLCPVEVVCVPRAGAAALTAAAGPRDLLVVTCATGRGWRELLFGSLAEQCAHRARGALVAVPEWWKR